MIFNVTLTIKRPDQAAVDKLLPALDAAPFKVTVATDENEMYLYCLGIGSNGNMALLEALRRAQVGLSPIFRATVPEYAERGGLLWGDITDAHVWAVE